MWSEKCNWIADDGGGKDEDNNALNQYDWYDKDKEERRQGKYYEAKVGQVASIESLGDVGKGAYLLKKLCW